MKSKFIYSEIFSKKIIILELVYLFQSDENQRLVFPYFCELKSEVDSE